MNDTNNLHAQTRITTTAYNPATRRRDYEFAFAFGTREQYHAFRRSWKEHYAALSRTIRDRKQLIKSAMRHHEYPGDLQRELRDLGLEATVQMLMLESAKRESCRQYLAKEWPRDEA